MSTAIYHQRYASTQSDGALAEIILIHGWGIHGDIWDLIIDDLLPYYHITIVDLPGFGRSSINSSVYSLEMLADSVLAVAPKKAIWLGWSLGGLVATQAAMIAPERVQILVNIASIPCWCAKPHWECAVSPMSLEKFQNLLETSPEKALVQFLSWQNKNSVSMKAEIRYVRERAFLYGMPDIRALVGGLQILLKTDLRAALENLKMPMGYWFGEQDTLIPKMVITELKKFLPTAHTEQHPQAAHLPFISHKNWFLNTLKSWLLQMSIAS